MNEAYYEEIFAESEEMTIEAVTEPPSESVTEETTIVIPDEYFMADVTSGTELEAIFFQVSEINSYAAIIAENTEINDHYDVIVSDINRLTDEFTEHQINHTFLLMLTCGLLGIIIGICFVNIFKDR